jgi:uncharacterized Tic20 family protein
MVLAFVVLALSVIGWVIIWLVPTVWVIFRIIAAMKAAQGDFYKIPISIRFIKL